MPPSLLRICTVISLLIAGSALSAEELSENRISGVESGLEYKSYRNSSISVQSFSIPIAIPLETSIRNFSIRSSILYSKKEYRRDDQVQTIEGASYFKLAGGIKALRTQNSLLELSESINVPLSHGNDENIPREAWINQGGYKIDSRLAFTYFFQRSSLKFDLEHNWNLAHKNFDKGENINATIIFGYGLDSLSPASYNHFNISVGLKSKYQYEDRMENKTVEGSSYGTLFFSPGFQYLSSSLNLWADIDLPVHRVQSSENSLRDGPSGRIGIKYLFE